MKFVRSLAVFSLLSVAASATVIPRLSFEDVVSQSERIIYGKVARQWCTWGPEHRIIWTRTEIQVDGVLKGAPSGTVTVSEPGGELDGVEMAVAGAVPFVPGERVTLFLKSVATGDLRTVGWTQGKFTTDAAGHVLPEASGGPSIVPLGRSSGTDIRSLRGITANDLHSRVRSLVTAKGPVR